MRRYRRARSSGREDTVNEYFDTSGLEAEPMSQGPDDDFSLRPFSEGDAYQDVFPEIPVTTEGPDPAALLRRARRASRGGRHSDAVQAYRDLLRAAEDHLEGRLEMARLLESGDDTTGALIHLDRAVEIAPDRPDVLTERGALKTRLKQYLPAATDLDAAIKIDPDFAPAHFELGMVLLRRGRAQEASIEFRNALDIQHDLPDAHYYLGEALNLLGDFDAAITVLEKAVEREPDQARGYQLLGRVLDRCSRPEEAMAMYQKAREVAGR